MLPSRLLLPYLMWPSVRLCCAMRGPVPRTFHLPPLAVQKIDQEKKDKKRKKKEPKTQEKASAGTGSVTPLAEGEDWEGKHPWRPFDREKDLGPGLKSKDAKVTLSSLQCIGPPCLLRCMSSFFVALPALRISSSPPGPFPAALVPARAARFYSRRGLNRSVALVHRSRGPWHLL